MTWPGTRRRYGPRSRSPVKFSAADNLRGPGRRAGSRAPSTAPPEKTPETKGYADDNTAGPGDPRAGSGEVVQGAARAARRGLRRGPARGHGGRRAPIVHPLQDESWGVRRFSSPTPTAGSQTL